MQKIEIISEPNNDFVVIYKPQGLPSAPLLENDLNNALCQAESLFPEIKTVSGLKKIEHGLLHRLDTETEGLILIAKNQEFYDFMQKEQKEGRFIKTYKAECISILESENKEGYPPLQKDFKSDLLSGKTIEISSYFRHYGKEQKEVRPVTIFSGKAALKKIGKQKEYATKVELLEKYEYKCESVGENANKTATISENRYEARCILECTISAGFRHQVRSHLAWIGFPIVGDALYNPFYKENEKLKFKATKLEFTNKRNGKKYVFTRKEI